MRLWRLTPELNRTFDGTILIYDHGRRHCHKGASYPIYKNNTPSDYSTFESITTICYGSHGCAHEFNLTAPVAQLSRKRVLTKRTRETLPRSRRSCPSNMSGLTGALAVLSDGHAVAIRDVGFVRSLSPNQERSVRSDLHGAAGQTRQQSP